MSKLALKNSLISLFSIIWLTAIFILPSFAQAQGTYNFASSSGLSTTGNKAGYITDASASSIEDIVGTIVYIIIGFVGVLFLILAIYGAVTWMTAMGNEEKVKKANGMLMSALIGLIITLSAYVISYFLINYFW
jgi:hypothetical protein